MTTVVQILLDSFSSRLISLVCSVLHYKEMLKLHNHRLFQVGKDAGKSLVQLPAQSRVRYKIRLQGILSENGSDRTTPVNLFCACLFMVKRTSGICGLNPLFL